MKRARRLAPVALAALLFGLASCRGCSCVEGEKTFEKLDGKYSVELVRKTHWSGGRIPGPVSNFYVRIGTTPPIEEPVSNCTRVDLAEDDAGKFVAFRCHNNSADDAWTVVRLRGGDRRIRECGVNLGRNKPEWTRIDPVRSITNRVFGCERAEDHYAVIMRELARAIAEDDGATKAGDYVGRVLASVEPARTPDPWDAALGALDETGRTTALSKLCHELARVDGKASPTAYVRAARHCALDGTGALASFRAFFALPPPAPPQTEGDNLVALLWAGLLAARTNPNETGQAVCESAASESLTDDRGAVLAELLGETKTKCDVVARWLEMPPCDFRLDCDGGLCSSTELARFTAGWDADLDGGLRADPNPPERERALLRAAYAAGPLPRAVVLANDRRRYALADAGDLPGCYETTQLEAGAPCQCRIHPLDVCHVSATEHTLENAGCRVTIDDAHHKLDVPRHACGERGARCYPHPCCGSMVCERGSCEWPDAGENPDSSDH